MGKMTFGYSVSAVDGGGARAYNHFKRPEKPQEPMPRVVGVLREVSQLEVLRAKLASSGAVDVVPFDPYNTQRKMQEREQAALKDRKVIVKGPFGVEFQPFVGKRAVGMFRGVKWFKVMGVPLKGGA